MPNRFFTKQDWSMLPWAAVFAIALIATVEIIFTNLAEPLTGLPWLQPTADDGMVVAKRSMFDSIDGRWIIVGDSSALHGLRPDILLETSGIDAVNLGTLSSLTTVGFSEMAVEAMEKTDIAGIIYAVLPQSLEVSEADAARFGQLDRYLAAYGSRLHLRHIPLQAHLDRQVRRHRVNKFPPHFEGSVQRLGARLRERSGFYPERNSSYEAIVKQDFAAQSFAIEGIEAAAAYAARANVPFIVLLMPKPEFSVSTNYVNGVQTFLNTLTVESAQLNVVPDQWQTLPAQLFGSETHLTEAGAEHYTKTVARSLSELAGIIR